MAERSDTVSDRVNLEFTITNHPHDHQPMKVYLNGSILDASQATISFEDAGFQHGVGVFETMAAVNGRVFRLNHHLLRLQKSANELGLARDVDIDELAVAVNEAVEANGIPAARVRLTYTAGSVSMLRKSEDPAAHPTVLVVVAEPTRYDPAYFENGIMVLVAPPSLAS